MNRLSRSPRSSGNCKIPIRIYYHEPKKYETVHWCSSYQFAQKNVHLMATPNLIENSHPKDWMYWVFFNPFRSKHFIFLQVYGCTIIAPCHIPYIFISAGNMFSHSPGLEIQALTQGLSALGILSFSSADLIINGCYTSTSSLFIPLPSVHLYAKNLPSTMTSICC